MRWMNLTQRQSAVLSFISSYHALHGYGPSTREIAQSFGFTQTAAVQHVCALKRKGAVKTTPRVPRSIVVL